MDLATLVGIVLGLVMVVFGIISSADISAITKSFLDLPSFIITFGGSIAGMIGSYTFKELITCIFLACHFIDWKYHMESRPWRLIVLLFHVMTAVLN